MTINYVQTVQTNDYGSEILIDGLINKADPKIETSYKVFSAVKMFIDSGNDTSI